MQETVIVTTKPDNAALSNAHRIALINRILKAILEISRESYNW